MKAVLVWWVAAAALGLLAILSWSHALPLFGSIGAEQDLWACAEDPDCDASNLYEDQNMALDGIVVSLFITVVAVIVGAKAVLSLPRTEQEDS